MLVLACHAEVRPNAQEAGQPEEPPPEPEVVQKFRRFPLRKPRELRPETTDEMAKTSKGGADQQSVPTGTGQSAGGGGRHNGPYKARIMDFYGVPLSKQHVIRSKKDVSDGLAKVFATFEILLSQAAWDCWEQIMVKNLSDRRTDQNHQQKELDFVPTLPA